MRCLVVTPIPTVPADQGNAVNIARLNACIRLSGYEIHMVYSTLEGMDRDNLRLMALGCDYLDIVPFRGMQGGGQDGYRLDDWYDPAVGEHVAALCGRFRYDVALIHYVWMSAVSASIPATVRKVLYTHDRFGGRNAMLARSGIAPTWYSIPIEDEAKGLARVDCIIATQEEEASYFRTLVDRPVHVLGSLQALRQTPRRARVNGTLRAGYIGSANPGNQRSIRDLLMAIDATPELSPDRFALHLAGPISRVEEFRRPYVTALGIVGRPEDIYRQVDVMLNPSIGGSGLKIKSVECLAAGMPLVSTRDGMMGLAALHPAMECADAAGLARELARLINSGYCEALVEACRRSISLYAAEQVEAFHAVFGQQNHATGAVPGSSS